MRAIDTNVLVRYITQDDAVQSPIASTLVREIQARNEAVFVTQIVLCETIWVLRSYYRISKSDIATFLGHLLDDDGFEIDGRMEVVDAFSDFQKGKGDFSDYLIGRLAATRKCGPVFTFDRNLAGSKSFKVM